jgi:hypothetical protein
MSVTNRHLWPIVSQSIPLAAAGVDVKRDDGADGSSSASGAER